jgi:hypothetical protein
MRRRLLNLLTLLSLLLCVAVVALWVRDWDLVGPGGEPPGWRGTLEVKAPDTRPIDQPTQVGDLVYFTLDDLEGPGVVTERRQRVANDGTVLVPYVGRERVLCLNAREIELRLAAAYHHPHDVYNKPRRCAVVATGDWRVPYRLLAFVLGMLPAARLIVALPAVLHWRSNRRIAAGLCPSCGYDLRATPGRCPECGTDVGAHDARMC